MLDLASDLRPQVKTMLMYPGHFEWSVQGLGMLRTYLDKDKRYRLNIWDATLQVPNVSVIHDHPWSFTSRVLAGRFRNTRYIEADPYHDDGAAAYHWAVILCGEGGGPEGERGDVYLKPCETELYFPGDVYHQEPTEIHESGYNDGTVTINDRVPLPDGHHARVFWPFGEEWVSAEPRPATPQEVADTTRKALAAWTL